MKQAGLRCVMLAVTVALLAISLVPNQLSQPKVTSLWDDSSFVEGWAPSLETNGEIAVISTQSVPSGFQHDFASPLNIGYFPRTTFVEIRYRKSDTSQGSFWIRISDRDTSGNCRTHSFGDNLQSETWYTATLDVGQLKLMYYGYYPYQMTSIGFYLEPKSVVEIDYIKIYTLDRTNQIVFFALAATMVLVTAISFKDIKFFGMALICGWRRFLLPVLAVILAKAVAISSLYFRLQPSSYLTLFINWDSNWYIGIIDRGYVGKAWAFFPGYPITAYAIKILTGDPKLSAVVVSLIFGILCVPAFQLMAEHYMSWSEAMEGTLIVTFFPITFLFTTVAYSEPLFLFASLMCWHLYLDERILSSSVFAAIAAITRPYGIIIVLPILLDCLLKRKWRDALKSVIPVSALFSWLCYGYLTVGDWLAFRTAQETWGQNDWLRSYLLPFLVGSYVGFDAARLVLIVMFGYLAFASWKVDWRICLYALVLFFGILGFSDARSYIRYFSFIFPVWLSVPRTKNVLVVMFLISFFFVHALSIWHQFIMGWVA
ncbi:hypothetical protein KEJ39_01960 [Candidatus Bathyarchaeota archaeon]|nr:hypothetical protein [Candidatus Bathyarchaeota archaeon]